MLVTNALLRHTSLIMFLVFFTMETLLFISVLFAFKFELPGNNETIIQNGKTNNIEIINSFSSILNSTINSITLDLLLIYQNINANKYFPIDNCSSVNFSLSYDSKEADQIKRDLINKKVFYINNEMFIQNELKENKDDFFNNIYKYNCTNYNNLTVDNNISRLLPGFKSLLYKHIINGQNDLVFNQLYLTVNNSIYVYPPVNDTDLLLSIKNNEKTCDDIKTNKNAHALYFKLANNNAYDLQYYHNLNDSLILFSCLYNNTFNELATNFSLCLENNLQPIFNFSFNNKNTYSYFNIAITDENFTLLNSFYKDVQHNNDNNVEQCKHNLSLFTFLYSDILDHLNNNQYDIEFLENECKNIYNKLSQSTTQSTSSIFDFVTQISYLETTSNSTPSINKFKQDFCIISIKPINLQYLSINNNSIINVNISNNPTHYIIAIMKMNINSKFKKLFYIFFFRLFTKWSFFTILLIICCSLFSVIFTKYLDSIFSPISIIIKHFRLKLFNQTEKPLEENEEVSITKCNSSISQLESKTPEIIDLIETSKFLVNILDMKKLLENKIEVSEINFNLMNCIFSELRQNEEKIQYGFFLSSFYYQTKKYNDCWKSIKNIKTHLQYEKEIVINEKENIEIDLLNHLSK